MEKLKKKAPISIASRKAKARELQKYVAQKISDITGIPCGKDELIESREMGQAGSDVKLIGPAQKLFPFAVECKRTEKLDLHGAIRQAEANTKPELNWIIVHRRSKEDALVTIKADVFFEIYRRVINEVHNSKDNNGE
jgi:hypothetical protein